MNRSLTPGRLALWGVLAVIVGAILALVLNRAFDDDGGNAAFLIQALSVIAYAIGILLLLGAGIAKAVQIGNRSAND